MTTLPTPLPPPLPPPEINQSRRIRQTPLFSHATLPYSLCRPVQETNPPLEALHEGPAVSLTRPGQGELQLTSSEGHEDSFHSLETTDPVQETDPAPQTQVRSEDEESADQMGQVVVEEPHGTTSVT